MKRGVMLIGLGILAHVASALLTGWFIERKMPGLLEMSAKLPPDADGELLWEKTAGKGIVPRWVSLVGLPAIPLFLLGVVLLLWSVFD